jgi:hypothetical protein
MLWSGIRICLQVSLILPFTPHTYLGFESIRHVFRHAFILSIWLSRHVTCLRALKIPGLSKFFTEISTNKLEIAVARNPDRSPELLEAVRPVPAVYTTVGSLVDPNAVRAFTAPNRIQREGANRRPLATASVFNRSFGSSNSLFLPLSPATLRNQNNMHYAQQISRGRGMGQLSVASPLVTSPIRALPIRALPIRASPGRGIASARASRRPVRPQPVLTDAVRALVQKMTVSDQITWGDGSGITPPGTADIFTWFIDEEPVSPVLSSPPKRVQVSPRNITIPHHILAELTGETRGRANTRGHPVAGLDIMQNLQTLSESDNPVQDIARTQLSVFSASIPESAAKALTNATGMNPLERVLHNQRASSSQAKAMHYQGTSSMRDMYSQGASSSHGMQNRAATSIQGIHNQSGSASQGMQNRAATYIQGIHNQSSYSSQGMQNRAATSIQGIHNQSGYSSQGMQNRAATSIQGMQYQVASSSQGMQNRAAFSTQDMQYQVASSSQGMQNRAAFSTQDMQYQVASPSQGMQSQVQGSLDQGYRFPPPGLATSFNSQANPLLGASAVPSHMGSYGINPQPHSIEAGNPHLDGSLKSMTQTSNTSKYGWTSPCHYCGEVHLHPNSSCLQYNEGRVSAPSAPPGYPQPLTAGPPGQRHYAGGSSHASSGYTADQWGGNQYSSMHDNYNAQAEASPWAGTSMHGNANSQADASSWAGASMHGNANSQVDASSWGNPHGNDGQASGFSYDPNKFDLSKIDLRKVPFNPPEVLANMDGDAWNAPIHDTLTHEQAGKYYGMGAPTDITKEYQPLSEETKIKMESVAASTPEDFAEMRKKVEDLKTGSTNSMFYIGQQEFHEKQYEDVLSEMWEDAHNPYARGKKPTPPNPFGPIGQGRPSKKTNPPEPAVTKKYTVEEWNKKPIGECCKPILNAALINMLRYSQKGPDSWAARSGWVQSPSEHIDPTPEGNRSVYGEDWGKPAHL